MVMFYGRYLSIVILLAVSSSLAHKDHVNKSIGTLRTDNLTFTVVLVLVGLTIIFILVIVSLYPMATYLGVKIPISTMIALVVCLIPTTIGGLLSAIGIAGMNSVTRFNVIAMSRKDVEACGDDVDTRRLDKTGTITFGNRLAAEFIPVGIADKLDLIKYSVMCSLKDETPEGKSTVDLIYKLE